MNYKLLIVLILLVIAFFVGRMTVTTKETVRYVKDEPVSGVLSDLQPVRETVPAVPLFPMRRDTVWRDSIVYIAEKVDTAAIIADYITSREYAPVLFDNAQYGRLSLLTTVQYNKLQEIKYEFLPVTGEIIRYRERVFQPFVGTSYNTFNQAALLAGLYYNKTGWEAQLIYDLQKQKRGYGIGFKYKF